MLVNLDGQKPVVTDFVISCRVAMKAVEHAVFEKLREVLADMGHEELELRFRKTERNSVVREVLNEIGFTSDGAGNAASLLTLDLQRPIPRSDIVQVYCEKQRSWFGGRD